MAAEAVQEVKQRDLLKEDLLYVGKTITRIDSLEKVTGRSVYGVDFSLPHMLFGKFKRSDVPHAEILNIDTTSALKVSGVRAILTGKDLPDTLFGAGLSDMPIMARTRVRFVGEPVAAVAADTPESAAEAADLIEVSYKEIPAVFDPEESLKENPVAILHPDLMSYKVTPKLPPVRDPKLPNVGNHVKVRKGDMESAFKSADKIIENRFSTNLVQHVHTEPNATVAQVENDGSVTVWTSTQSVYRARYMLSEALELPASRVRVISTEVGGGFGNKLNSVVLEAVAVLLSKATGRPVKMQLTREEVFSATTTRHPFVIYVKDGVMNDGRLIARQIRAILDGGAYSGGSGVTVGRNTVFGAVTTYDIPNICIDTYRVYTNKVPSGAFRGYGTMQMTWAIECQMDVIAEKLGIDPVQLRMLNVLIEGRPSGIGEMIPSIDHIAVLAEACKMIDLNKKTELSLPWKTGKGVALSEKYSGEPGACASIRFRSDGLVEVFVAVQEIGQGTRTGVAQIVADELKMPIHNIRIVQADTFLTPYDAGAVSSRQTYSIGNACILACSDLKKNILQTTSKRFGISHDLLTIGEGLVYLPNGKSIMITDLFIHGKSRYGIFLEKGDEFWGYGTWFVETGDLDPETGQATLPRINITYTSGAWAVEVAVNMETGEVKLLRTIAVANAGKVINPKLAETQVEGAVSQGISTSLYEELILERGRAINADFKDYKMLTIQDATQIEVKLLEIPSGDGPYGAKPLGEVGIVGIAPAIANAIHDATGVRINDLPITREKVLRAIKAPIVS